jgi:hypothetical protein
VTRVVVGIVVGATVALALGAATDSVLRERMRKLAASCCLGDSDGDGMNARKAAAFAKRLVEAIGERCRAAVEESRAAAADERQRLWARFERARDTGRADTN